MKLRALIILTSLMLPGIVRASGSAGSEGTVEPRFLLDVPTAGMIAEGSFALDLDFYRDGGVLSGFSIGLLNRLSAGVSYGGTRIIGSESPIMNELPGVNIKVRVIEEGFTFPAIVIGFDSQGRDGYDKNLNRYAVKSPGFYVAGSKNYSMAGFFSIHGGVSYSLERADEDRDVNFFAGVEKTVGPIVSVMLEYNVATNDDEGKAVGRGRGYLNAGIKWSIGGGLTLGVSLKDLTKNGGDVNVGNRTVKIEYVKPF